MRDTSNLDRVYGWLCYVFDQKIRLRFSNAPNWISVSHDAGLGCEEGCAAVSLIVIPRHEDVRSEDGLQCLVRRFWKAGDNVVVWQFNGVLYYVSVSPETGTLLMDVPVGRMRKSVEKLFDKISESDEINKRKRVFTHMSRQHIDHDMENDVV